MGFPRNTHFQIFYFQRTALGDAEICEVRIMDFLSFNFFFESGK